MAEQALLFFKPIFVSFFPPGDVNWRTCIEHFTMVLTMFWLCKIKINHSRFFLISFLFLCFGNFIWDHEGINLNHMQAHTWLILEELAKILKNLLDSWILNFQGKHLSTPRKDKFVYLAEIYIYNFCLTMLLVLNQKVVIRFLETFF